MYPEFCVVQKQQSIYPLHKITQSYNPHIQDLPRQRLPNENPKDYMLNTYQQLIHVMDISSTSSIYRLDPFAKYFCCWINSVCPDEVSAISERTKWKHPNLVSFHFFDDVSEKFSQNKSLKIYYEYLPLDVKTLIEKRASVQEHVPEDEIWNMIQGLTAAMLFLQKRGITHSALTLESVYFDEEYLLYRVQDVSPFRARAPHLFENQYKAPEINGTLRVNRFKVDVFGLGMIILSLCLLKPSDYIYDPAGINRFQLNACMDRVRKIYSGRVVEALQKMLILDLNERPDWVEFSGIIQNLKCYQLQDKLNQSYNSSQQGFFNKTQECSYMSQQSYQSQQSQLNQQCQQENNIKEANLLESTKSGESIDQKLMNLNKRIQETLAKSQNKQIR